jgi:spectinomycin phosphotransferase
MLEKPDLQDEEIITCLQEEYRLRAVQFAFLPLGADLNTAVYRLVADDGTPYFLKLRSGIFDETSVTLPKYLSDQEIVQIIPPLATQTGQLWASLEAYKVILYPFVEGHNGYEVNLSDRHWVDLGTALKRIHTAVVPAALTIRIQQETYSPQWRETVKMSMKRIEYDVLDDPVAVKMAAFLQANRAEILDLVGRAERLALALQARSPEFVLCHSDIHAGNILIGPSDDLYIVDWDNPILAPKERDLMYAGGGLMGAGHTPHEEEILFYQGYGQTQIDPVAQSYYRYERIVQDIAIYCEQILLTNEGGEDRDQSLHYLKSIFLPNSTIEIAYQADKTLRQG